MNVFPSSTSPAKRILLYIWIIRIYILTNLGLFCVLTFPQNFFKCYIPCEVFLISMQSSYGKFDS